MTVVHAGGTLTFAPEYADALHTVLDSGGGIRVGEIPGLGGEQQLELVDRLIRAGIVVADRATSPGR